MKTRLCRSQIIGSHSNANMGNVNLATRCILFRTKSLDLRRDINRVSQSAASIRKKKRSKDHSETKRQMVRTHCKRENVTMTSGVVNKGV
jgi:hypothetical protein